MTYSSGFENVYVCKSNSIIAKKQQILNKNRQVVCLQCNYNRQVEDITRSDFACQLISALPYKNLSGKFYDQLCKAGGKATFVIVPGHDFDEVVLFAKNCSESGIEDG